MKKNIKKTVLIILTLAVFTSAVFILKDKLFGNNSQAATVDRCTVRVLLSTMMASNKDVQVTVNGNYSIKNIEDPNYSFRNGVLLRKMTYTLSVLDGNVAINDGRETFILGSNVTFYSHDAGRNSYLTMKNSSYGTCNYIGNMKVYVSGGNTLNFINELDMEDYLCGVVPYEMSEGQAVESLKVQTICARSYVNDKVARSPNATYHVNDTTSTQVYKGYKASNVKSIAAVDATAREVLSYNGKYVSAYYSASNGGLTETTANIWSSNLAYYPVKVDEYDTSWRNRRYTVSKTAISEKNQEYLRSQLKTSIEKNGYDYDTLEVLSINHLYPKYNAEPASIPETSRRVSSIEVELTVRAKKTGSASYDTFTQRLKKSKDNVRSIVYFVNPDGNDGRVLSSTRFTVSETETEIICISHGNGHGVGMSQNGTYARVKAGQTYKEIIDFYYTGTDIVKLQVVSYTYEDVPGNEYLDSQIASYAQFDNKKIANTIIDTPVYEKPGAIYAISGSIAKDVFVSVLGETPDWYSVSTDDGTVSGFVMKKNIFVHSDDLLPDDSKDVLKLGKIIADADVRSSAVHIGTNIIGSIPKDSEIMVMDNKLPFYEVLYNGELAYVLAENIELTDIAVNEIAKADVTAYKASLYSESNDTSAMVGYLQEGAHIEIFDISENYAGLVFNGSLVYIKTDKINITERNVRYDAFRKDNSVNVKLELTNDANIFRSENETDILASLKAGDVVNATALANGYYKIVYNSSFAYIRSDTVRVSSELIGTQYAVLIADKNAYSAADMGSVALSIPAGTALKITAKTGDVLTVSYKGSTYFITSADADIKSEQAVIGK